jgi:AraC-like DNA-binding protein
MHKHEKPKESPEEFDRSEGLTSSYYDWEKVCLLEEHELSLRATGIIKRSRELQRLKVSPRPIKVRPSQKIPSHMPLCIDSHALESLITDKLEGEQVYLDEAISLAAFAHELDLEPHHLSRFLNIHLQTTFTRLINTYRVNAAKTLLTSRPGETVLAIAFSSGFNSKASFNRIFKRSTGMTPSEYRLKMKGSNVRSYPVAHIQQL